MATDVMTMVTASATLTSIRVNPRAFARIIEACIA
jgi:hypothetical protein